MVLLKTYQVIWTTRLANSCVVKQLEYNSAGIRPDDVIHDRYIITVVRSPYSKPACPCAAPHLNLLEASARPNAQLTQDGYSTERLTLSRSPTFESP